MQENWSNGNVLGGGSRVQAKNCDGRAIIVSYRCAPQPSLASALNRGRHALQPLQGHFALSQPEYFQNFLQTFCLLLAPTPNAWLLLLLLLLLLPSSAKTTALTPTFPQL